MASVCGGRPVEIAGSAADLKKRKIAVVSGIRTSELHLYKYIYTFRNTESEGISHTGRAAR